MPTALDTLYCTQGDVEALLSAEGVSLRLNDSDPDGDPTTAESAYLTTQGINYATARINNFCLGRYEAADLATDWVINDWATVLAAYWLSCRRGNDPPKSLALMRKEVLDELALVRGGRLALEGINQRISESPGWSNIRFPSYYRVRQLRVQRPISEGTNPTNRPQNRDRQADYTFEW